MAYRTSSLVFGSPLGRLATSRWAHRLETPTRSAVAHGPTNPCAPPHATPIVDGRRSCLDRPHRYRPTSDPDPRCPSWHPRRSPRIAYGAYWRARGTAGVAAHDRASRLVMGRGRELLDQPRGPSLTRTGHFVFTLSNDAMRSDTIKRGIERAPHRSLLRATGQVKDGDWDRPFIAICNSYVDIIPGHVHLQAFGNVVKEAVRAAGGIPFEFNTIGVDDGIVMGHEGMHYSLPSRELIADSVETMVARPLLRRADLHPELRQDRPRHAHGRRARQRPDDLRLRRTDGGGARRPQRQDARPDLRLRGRSASAPPGRSTDARLARARAAVAVRPAAAVAACSPPTR